MKRKIVRTIALGSFALVVVLSTAWQGRKRRTPKRRIRAWPRLTST